MKNLLRLQEEPISADTKEKWISESAGLIRELVTPGPTKIILVGSAAYGRFDRYSDLDFVVVCKTLEEATAAQKALYRNTPRFPCPVEFVCVEESDYEKKSLIGGILFTARQEGKAL
jgi:predicted nucleotidyltransferase